MGLGPRQLRDIVLSVTRGGRTLRFDDPLIGTLEPEDVLVVVRSHPPGGQLSASRRQTPADPLG